MAVPLEALAPGGETIVRLALERVKPGTRVLVLGSGAGILTQLFSGHTSPELVLDETAGDRLDAVDAFDLVVCLNPSRLGPLLQVLGDLRDALAPEGHALVSDLVWQTAPSPQLAQAFAPQPGREKVRPIEGYEMQLDHAGFTIVERLDFGRAEWLTHFQHHAAAGAQAAAIAADDRGAARYAAWLLRKA